jgi:hypothetical protein
MNTTKKKEIEFYSRGRGLVVGIEPPAVHFDARGERVESGGSVADFGLGNGFFTTDDPDVADHLRSCESFGTDFWETGSEVGGIKPTVADAVIAISEAAVAHDAEALETVIHEEKATHNRAEVLGAAQAALANVRTVLSAGVPRTEPEVVAAEASADPGARPAETTEAEAAAASAATEGSETKTKTKAKS